MIIYTLQDDKIKSRWLVGTDDLFTVETIHSINSMPAESQNFGFFSKFGFNDNLIKKLKRIS